MDNIGPNELSELIGARSGLCVSVYLPTHVGSQQGQQDRVRLKNLLRRAEQQLVEGGMRGVEAQALLQPARELPTDPTFWEARSHGLAVFVSQHSFDCFRLPLQFQEMAIVNRRFHVRPLLPMLTAGDQFFILALSQHNPRLFAASRYAIEPIELLELNTTMEDALNYVTTDRGSQTHSAMRGSLGKQAAVFHGKGGQPETHKEDLTQFMRIIASALQPRLRDERSPMLLAGVEYLLPMYREVNRYPHVVSEELTGNCERLSAHQLHEKAWPLMQPALHRERDGAAAKYLDLKGSDKACDDIRAVAVAAHGGRVDALFIDHLKHFWGSFDPEAHAIELHERCESGDEDLLDLAAVQTIIHGGTVYCMSGEEMPNGSSVAAILRF